MKKKDNVSKKTLFFNPNNTIEFTYEWLIFRINIKYSEEKKIINLIKKRINRWEGITDIVTFNRKGKITKITYNPQI